MISSLSWIKKNCGKWHLPNRSIPLNEGAELRMNFLLDITPDADIELIMDPVAGDKITGNCNGRLQIQYGTKTDLRMYGNIGIVQGNYIFSLQQLIHKNFKIRDGSIINFRGDPFEATMNVNTRPGSQSDVRKLPTQYAGQLRIEIRRCAEEPNHFVRPRTAELQRRAPTAGQKSGWYRRHDDPANYLSAGSEQILYAGIQCAI